MSVDEYIAAQSADVQGALARVRAAIRRAAPSAQEVISYNMPTYKKGGETFLQFAAWKEHYALYLATAPLVESFKDELKNCKIDKGTIRFSFSDPVPEALIERIVKFQLSSLKAS